MAQQSGKLPALRLLWVRFLPDAEAGAGEQAEPSIPPEHENAHNLALAGQYE